MDKNRLLSFCNPGMLILAIAIVSISSCKTTSVFVDGQIQQKYRSSYFGKTEIESRFEDCFSQKANCDGAAFQFSLIGNYASANLTWDLQEPGVYVAQMDTATDLGRHNLINSIDFIEKAAADKRVIMINEAHHRPENRIFTKLLLKRLKQSGFNYLGLEGLHPGKDSIFLTHTPTMNSGYYIREPHYGNLIREAQDLDYQVFGYDFGGRGKERELRQAKIIHQILLNDPAARIIVHAGWGHIREDTAILGGLMAYEFKKISGIDPFTINQTRYISASQPALENPLFRNLKPRLDAPFTLVETGSNAPVSDRITDIAVLNPKNGIAYYLEEMPSKSVCLKNIPANGGLILLFPEGEDLTIFPVPVFINEISKGQRTVSVHVGHEGKYDLYLLTPEKLLFLKKIKIK